MTMWRMAAVVSCCSAICGCSSGGGSSNELADYCLAHFLDGATQADCPDCVTQDYDVVIDDDGSTFVEMAFAPGGTGTATVRATAPFGTTFNSGSNAGALARFPNGAYENIGIRFQTYLSGVNVTGGTNGEFTATGNVSGNGSDKYYAFSPNSEFDAIEVILNLGGNDERAIVRLYEICADR